MLIQLSLILLMELSSTLKKLSLGQTLAWERSAHYIFVHLHFSHHEVDAEGGDVSVRPRGQEPPRLFSSTVPPFIRVLYIT